MWLFWGLVSALPIFPRSKALKQFNKNRKTLGRWKWVCYSGFCRREVDKIDGSGPKASPSLSLSLRPHVKGTAMCQTLGRWSRVSYRSGSQHAQSGGEDRPINVQIMIYWAMGLRNHIQNVLNAQRMDRMRELTVRGVPFGRILKSK